MESGTVVMVTRFVGPDGGPAGGTIIGVGAMFTVTEGDGFVREADYNGFEVWEKGLGWGLVERRTFVPVPVEVETAANAVRFSWDWESPDWEHASHLAKIDADGVIWSWFNGRGR